MIFPYDPHRRRRRPHPTVPAAHERAGHVSGRPNFRDAHWHPDCRRRARPGGAGAERVARSEHALADRRRPHRGRDGQRTPPRVVDAADRGRRDRAGDDGGGRRGADIPSLAVVSPDDGRRGGVSRRCCEHRALGVIRRRLLLRGPGARSVHAGRAPADRGAHAGDRRGRCADCQDADVGGGGDGAVPRTRRGGAGSADGSPGEGDTRRASRRSPRTSPRRAIGSSWC